MSKSSQSLGRYLGVFISVLYAAMGSSPRRQVDRHQLERAIGKWWTAFAMSLPVVLLVVWLSVWVFARIVPQEDRRPSVPLPTFNFSNTE